MKVPPISHDPVEIRSMFRTLNAVRKSIGKHAAMDVRHWIIACLSEEAEFERSGTDFVPMPGPGDDLPGQMRLPIEQGGVGS